MKLPKLFKKKQSKREIKELELIEDFNEGRVLHIDDDIENDLSSKNIVEEDYLDDVPEIELKVEEPVEEIIQIEPMSIKEKEWIGRVLNLNWGEAKVRSELEISKYPEERIDLFLNYYKLKLEELK